MALHLVLVDMKALIALTFSMLLFGAGLAQAAEPVRVLVSVGELSPNKDLQWRKDICAEVHHIGNQRMASGVQVSCRQDSIHVIDTYLQQLKGDNEYHIRILRGFKGSYRLSVSNWNRKYESDFSILGWDIGREPHMRERGPEGLRVVLGNFFSYLENETALKTEWLLNARTLSNSITYDFKNLTFKSVKDRKRITISTALRLFELENPENVDYLRSRQEMALAYAAISANNLNILNPEDTLLEILEKAALQGRQAALPWDHVISFDERVFSKLTVELIEDAAEESLQAPQTQSAKAVPAPVTNKKPLGKLIYLF